MQQLCRSDWDPGVQIDDFFFEIRRKFQHPGGRNGIYRLDARFPAPEEHTRQGSGKVRDVADDIEGVDGRGLIKTIKLELMSASILWICGK